MVSNRKILMVFGTRPEAIKMIPLYLKLKEDSFNVKLCITAQHRDMLDEVMNLFNVNADHDLDIMKPNQSLSKLSSRLINGLDPIYEAIKPDLVLVHGDTTSSYIAALVAFYRGIPVGHVEAGLRSGNIKSPFPEELNRKIVGNLADYHFAPTEKAKENLVSEGIKDSKILVCGNTVIDAVKLIVNDHDRSNFLNLFNKFNLNLDLHKEKLVLLTCHRRENFGDPMHKIFSTIKELAIEYKGVCHFFYPVHPNPNVASMANDILGTIENVTLSGPLDYSDFITLMNISHLILSDSGGIQEEASFLRKKILLLRDTTERPEAIDNGAVELVGTDPEKIIKAFKNNINSGSFPNHFNPNIYGDGSSSLKISNYLKEIQ